MLSLLAALALAAPPDAQTVTIDVDGVQRIALVVAPSGGGKHPVIFGFHGHGGNAQYAVRRFGLQEEWPDAVVVYPEGLPRASRIDPSGRFNGWDMTPKQNNPDIKFFDKLYHVVMNRYSGDPKRVFAMGHSNGGGFIYDLWILRAPLFAGFGSFEAAGALMGNLVPMPFFITIGDKDGIVPPALQRKSLAAAMHTDGSSDTGKPYGGMGTLYEGKEPLVFWSYPGTHVFQRDAVPTMIKFFQSIADKR